MISRIALSIFISALFIGCTSKTITVVDDTGRPVKGALVISEQVPYILQTWKLGVYLTNEQGKAEVVSNRGLIFKQGYYPVIESSELSDGLFWEPYGYFSDVTPIYPIKNDVRITVTSSTYRTRNPIDVGMFQVPLNVCVSKKITYNVENSRIKVSSNVQDITLSPRFYFAGPVNHEKVYEADRENNISFYCEESDNIYKIGISVAEKAWREGLIDHSLTILIARVPSFSSYIQPEVKCVNSDNVKNFTLGKYRDGKPQLYVSSNIKKRLVEVKENIPCSNESLEELFNYLDSYLK